MELMKNLRWMCRVCAVNIRKRRSSSLAVPIFDTPELLEKLKKYLHMDVEFNDKLPKSICSNCFKRLDCVYNFAVLAKKTENFLKDFISIAENNLKNASSSPLNARFQSEFASFALMSTEKPDIVICDEQTFNESDELAIDLEVNDRIFKEIEERVISVAEQPLSPAPLHFIPVKSNQQTVNSSPEKPIGLPQIKNSLDQKRRNLKRILANNNAQGTNKNASLPPAPPPLPQTSSPPEPQQQNLSNEPLMYDCLNLGCVIKDMDLLKLILKALKWPFTKDTLNAQIYRLKNTRFRDVMVDPNLLQDTDLMQILSSYLSPILLHSQNANDNSSTVNNVMSSLHTYKIPADTSVHLVSVPLESPEKRPRLLPQRKPRARRAYKSRVVENDSPIEILSDDDSQDIQKFEVNIDPALFFPADSESQENSSESLVMSLVGKPKSSLETNPNKVRKKHRRKEAHVKLHTDREEDEDLVIVNEEGHKIADFHEKESKGERNKQDILLDAESLDAQFPLVAIIDDNSNDDSMWAEFKVVESPLHGETSFMQQDFHRHRMEHRINESPEKQQEQELKKEIKQETVDTFECSAIKVEPTEQEAVQDHIKTPQNIAPLEDPVDNTSIVQAVDIKTEPELVDDKESSALEQKVAERGEGNNEDALIQEDKIKTEQAEDVEDLTNAEKQSVIEADNTIEDNLGTLLVENDKEQKRKDCTKSKEKVDIRKDRKDTDRVTRSASRVQSVDIDKRVAPRTSRRFSYSTTKKKDSKLSRPCKRICKQCGFIFRKSSNVAAHRKMHR